MISSFKCECSPLESKIQKGILSGRSLKRIHPDTTPVSCRGFTLLEIMVVIVLIAIAASLVMMNVGQSARLRQNRVFVSKMVEMCRKARLTAVGNGIPACLTIASESKECRIYEMEKVWDIAALQDEESEDEVGVFFDEPEPASKKGVLKIPEDFLVEGERIKSNDEGLFYICFYPDGSSSGGALTFSVEEEFKFTFQVDMLTGVVREVSSREQEE